MTDAVRQRTTVLLAYVGILPFLALTLAVLVGITETWVARTMVIYSLAIISFLAGTWWGFALMMKDVTAPRLASILIASNVIVLIAVAAALLLPPDGAALTLAILYAAILIGERNTPGLDRQPDYYRTMRACVTLIVAGLHLVFGWTFGWAVATV